MLMRTTTVIPAPVVAPPFLPVDLQKAPLMEALQQRPQASLLGQMNYMVNVLRIPHEKIPNTAEGCRQIGIDLGQTCSSLQLNMGSYWRPSTKMEVVALKHHLRDNGRPVVDRHIEGHTNNPQVIDAILHQRHRYDDESVGTIMEVMAEAVSERLLSAGVAIRFADAVVDRVQPEMEANAKAALPGKRAATAVEALIIGGAMVWLTGCYLDDNVFRWNGMQVVGAGSTIQFGLFLWNTRFEGPRQLHERQEAMLGAVEKLRAKAMQMGD